MVFGSSVHRGLRFAAAASLSGALFACGSTPEGSWQSRELVVAGGSDRNELTIETEGGSLKMFVQVDKDQGVTPVSYTLNTWFEEADGAYELQLSCSKSCETLSNAGVKTDFEMDCVYDSVYEWLDCDAKAPWAGYGFFEFELRAE